MKRINLLIISAFLCFSAFGQNKPLNDVVEIKLPKEVRKLAKENWATLSKSSSKKSEIDIKFEAGDFYELEGIKIILNSAIGSTPANHLEESKRGGDALYHLDGSPLPPGYSSTIKALNNYKVLLTSYKRKDYSYIHLLCVDNAHTAALAGVFEFEESNRAKAESELDKMLKSLKFK